MEHQDSDRLQSFLSAHFRLHDNCRDEIPLRLADRDAEWPRIPRRLLPALRLQLEKSPAGCADAVRRLPGDRLRAAKYRDRPGVIRQPALCRIEYRDRRTRLIRSVLLTLRR